MRGVLHEDGVAAARVASAAAVRADDELVALWHETSEANDTHHDSDDGAGACAGDDDNDEED
jgi:hypothetical protein